MDLANIAFFHRGPEPFSPQHRFFVAVVDSAPSPWKNPISAPEPMYLWCNCTVLESVNMALRDFKKTSQTKCKKIYVRMFI